MSPESSGGIERLRRAFTGHPSGEGGDCPDPGILWESARGKLDRTAEEELMLHIAACPDCATAWELAREMAETAEQREGPVVPLTSRRRPFWRRPRMLAAAATVLLAVGLGGTLLLRAPTPSPTVYRDEPGRVVVRAAPGSLRVPRGACRLRWTGAPEGSRFDLLVTDGELNVLFEAHRLREPACLVPAEKLPPAGGTILWRVTVHAPGGGTATSPTFETTIEE